MPGKSIAADFVAKTFIYTGDETGAGARPDGPPPGQRRRRAGAKPGAAAKAQTLKERAEGRGAE